MVENIYEISSLADALKVLIKQKSLTLRRVCLGCDINASYFSRALKGESNLSASQIFKILKFLDVTAELLDYLMLLWHLDQAQERSEKDYYREKVRVVQNEKAKISSRIESKVVKSPEQLQRDIQNYYSETATALTHMMLTVDKYAKQPHLISSHLGISAKKLNLEMSKLLQLGLIEQKKDGVKVNDGNIHLPEESGLSFQNHINWRLDVLNNLNQRESTFSDYHFSGAFTCDEESRLKIKKLLKDVIIDAQKIVMASSPIGLSRMLIDLY